jgi:predicted DCC family thiol-disulfide oxidoreductase YuxK
MASSAVRQPPAEAAGERAAAEALLAAKGFVPSKDRVVVFDGVCVMCNRGVDFLLRWDSARQFKYAALQSEAGQALALKYGAPRDLSTMVYIEGERAYVRSDAVLRIGARLFGFAPAARLALLTVPRPMRDWFYTNVVAKNRYDVFGKRDECRLVEPGQEDRFL